MDCGFAAVVLSYLGVGLYRRWAARRQILDMPTDRGAHKSPVVRGGGLVIVVLVLLGIWVIFGLIGPGSAWPALLAYTLGAVCIGTVSWLDDLRPLSNLVRFTAHSLGALGVIAIIGYWNSVSLPLLGRIPLGVAGALLTFFWIVGLTNAYNFMDGIDGIAGSQAVIAGAGWASLGIFSGQHLLGALGILVAACSLGFLGHNWPPARIFMGDIGSAFLGFTFAVMPLIANRLSGGGDSGFTPLIGLLLVWPFVFDASLTFFRRLLLKENVFKPHKSHLYQRLVSAGYEHQSVTLIYSSLALAGVLLARVWSPQSLNEPASWGVALPFLCFGLWQFTRDKDRPRGVAGQPMMRTRLLRYRKPIIIASQAALICLTYLASFLLRLDFKLEQPYLGVFLKTLPLILLIKVVVFYYFRLFSGWWRYVGVSDLLDIIKAALVSALLIYLAVYLSQGLTWYPRSVFMIDPILTICVIGGIRFAVRVNIESARQQASQAATVIVGAGQAGTTIARELRANEKLGYFPIGFADDDPTKRGLKIQGIKVLGSTLDLPEIIAKHDVSQILIAIPSATGKQIQRIMDICVQNKVSFKTLPALGDIINGSVTTGEIRNVRVDDLLARKPVRLDLDKIRAKFQDRIVMITGAGGSIGSELASQIASFKPTRLILYERAESDLHEISIEIAERHPNLNCIPAIGDILDVNRLREVMSLHGPNSVFHAAAYKHVPMMENNCFQAITNNIFGTYNVALIARQCGVTDFVMISSDKAVNPSNIMGVTKRVAELVILGLQLQTTRYVAVRFGNVLGSKGSVVPLFEQQIAQRRPVTVTDPEAKRYFMTIPEAVQLVLQASTMGRGGEIFVLDMGEQIKVVDLARDLIRLSGLEPDRDIPIVYTGLRPGEKLSEELRLDIEGIKPTAHEKIRVLDGGEVSFTQVKSWLDDLSALVNSKNVHGLVSKLREIVPEYSPSKEILTLSEVDRYAGIGSFDHARADPMPE
jgi:FlaA1/EpsC-like NDP-sugar epimerase/UDP-N-acetylmuramyl pentapeptide phosphotransferase/UDP-N-acetylglucosamine-1-phosphate transferase